MPPDLLSFLTEAGPLGVFACYLIWQRQKDSQRMDDTVTRLTERADHGENLIRDRFDAVVDKYDKEREVVFRDIVAKLDKLLYQQPTPKPPSPVSRRGSATESMIARAVDKAIKDQGDE